MDDESWARKRITSLLKSESDFAVVGEAADGEAAVQAITAAEHPDVVFLDVQMPGLSGLEVVEAIPPEQLPVIVFVTAYDKYAVQAFELHAVDYLLKPFDEERFTKTLVRVRDTLKRRSSGNAGDLRRLLETMWQGRPYLKRIGAKTAGRIVFLRVDDIDWVEATGNYLTLHAGKETHLIRETMNGLEPKLDPQQFVRVHRSSIVNLDRIKEIQPWFRGEQVMVLKDGTQVTVGRSYRDRLKQLLQNTVEP